MQKSDTKNEKAAKHFHYMKRSSKWMDPRKTKRYKVKYADIDNILHSYIYWMSRKKMQLKIILDKFLHTFSCLITVNLSLNYIIIKPLFSAVFSGTASHNLPLSVFSPAHPTIRSNFLIKLTLTAPLLLPYFVLVNLD